MLLTRFNRDLKLSTPAFHFSNFCAFEGVYSDCYAWIKSPNVSIARLEDTARLILWFLYRLCVCLLESLWTRKWQAYIDLWQIIWHSGFNANNATNKEPEIWEPAEAQLAETQHLWRLSARRALFETWQISNLPSLNSTAKARSERWMLRIRMSPFWITYRDPLQ